jgi:hypothetical protein
LRAGLCERGVRRKARVTPSTLGTGPSPVVGRNYAEAAGRSGGFSRKSGYRLGRPRSDEHENSASQRRPSVAAVQAAEPCDAPLLGEGKAGTPTGPTAPCAFAAHRMPPPIGPHPITSSTFAFKRGRRKRSASFSHESLAGREHTTVDGRRIRKLDRPASRLNPCGRSARRLPRRRRLAASAAGDVLPIRAERAPLRRAGAMLGASTGSFSSRNHLRIFATKLRMRRSYAHAVVSPIEHQTALA